MQMSVGGQFAQLSKSGPTVTCASWGDLSDLLTLTLALDGIPSSVIPEAPQSVEENMITRGNLQNGVEDFRQTFSKVARAASFTFLLLFFFKIFPILPGRVWRWSITWPDRRSDFWTESRFWCFVCPFHRSNHLPGQRLWFPRGRV